MVMMGAPHEAQLSLSFEEQEQLTRLETIIAEGVASFVRTGSALVAIRDQKLYRAEHRTFDAYINQRWPQIGSVRRAYQLIEASEVVENVQNFTHFNDTELPAPNEAQARELAVLPPEQQPEAWREAVETAPDGRVTARHTHEVVQALSTPAKPPEPETVGEAALQTFMADSGEIAMPPSEWKSAVEAPPSTAPPAPATPERPDTSGLLRTQTPAPVATTPPAAQAVATPAPVVDKRAVAAPQTPAAPTATAPAPKEAAPVAPASGMMSALIPAVLDDWLWEMDLTATTALELLRRVETLAALAGMSLADYVTKLEETTEEGDENL